MSRSVKNGNYRNIGFNVTINTDSETLNGWIDLYTHRKITDRFLASVNARTAKVIIYDPETPKFLKDYDHTRYTYDVNDKESIDDVFSDVLIDKAFDIMDMYKTVFDPNNEDPEIDPTAEDKDVRVVNVRTDKEFDNIEDLRNDIIYNMYISDELVSEFVAVNYDLDSTIPIRMFGKEIEISCVSIFNMLEEADETRSIFGEDTREWIEDNLMIEDPFEKGFICDSGDELCIDTPSEASIDDLFDSYEIYMEGMCTQFIGVRVIKTKGFKCIKDEISRKEMFDQASELIAKMPEEDAERLLDTIIRNKHLN